MPRNKERKRRPNGSGRIYKQNGVYYLQYRLPDGKRKSITLHDETGGKIVDLREAEKAAKLFLEPLQKINEIKSREEYLEQKAKLKKLAARTVIRLDDAFQRFLEKPRSVVPHERHIKVTKSRWDDFTAFVKARYHLTHIAEVEPEHADAYKFLTGIGIETQRKTTGGKRNQSVKDFHSLRHCFCYYAGIKGVPLPVIQSIVGHINPAMTKHYQDHADREARLKGISMMRGMVHAEPENSTLGMMRQRLRELAGTGSDQLIVKLNLFADKLLQEEKSGLIELPEIKVLPEASK